MSQTLTVNLPSELYVRIKKRADQANRSVEEEAIELLAATADAAQLGDAETIASLQLLDNESLERAARSHLAAEFAAELETLHFKQQRETLKEAEGIRCAELVRAYERSMLIRAHAAALLKKRGVDVSQLVAQP
jgi:plasmid stability protein